MASERPPPSLNDFHPLDAYVNKKSVARHHRALMLGFLGEVVTFLAYMLSAILVAPMRPFPDFASVAWWVFFAAHIHVVMRGVILKYALGENLFFSVAFAFLLFAPVLNVFAILAVNQEAIQLLKRAGLRIGFTGVGQRAYERIYAPWLCHWCDYDLTGNRSGVCPECGHALPVDMPAILAKREAALAETNAGGPTHSSTAVSALPDTASELKCPPG